jgi:hypothetical protein
VHRVCAPLRAAVEVPRAREARSAVPLQRRLTRGRAVARRGPGRVPGGRCPAVMRWTPAGAVLRPEVARQTTHWAIASTWSKSSSVGAIREFVRRGRGPRVEPFVRQGHHATAQPYRTGHAASPDVSSGPTLTGGNPRYSAVRRRQNSGNSAAATRTRSTPAPIPRASGYDPQLPHLSVHAVAAGHNSGRSRSLRRRYHISSPAMHLSA